MSDNNTIELTIDDLFSEIAEDLAETINGGLAKAGTCHYKLAA